MLNSVESDEDVTENDDNQLHRWSSHLAAYFMWLKLKIADFRGTQIIDANVHTYCCARTYHAYYTTQIGSQFYLSRKMLYVYIFGGISL